MGAWQQLAIVTPKYSEWGLSLDTKADWFRFDHINAPKTDTPLIICQQDDRSTYVEPTKLFSSIPNQLLYLPNPEPLSELRRIGVRLRHTPNGLPSAWRIRLSSYVGVQSGSPFRVQVRTKEGDTSMPFSTMPSPNVLQAKVTTEKSLSPVKDATSGKVASGELYAANPRRGGIFVQNLTNQALYLLFSDTATESASQYTKSLVVPANQTFETQVVSTERVTYAFHGEGIGEALCIEFVA